MRENAQGAVELTTAETDALAKRLIARHVADTDWLLWENLPELSEAAFNHLCDRVLAETRAMAEDSNRHDRSTGIDSQWIIGRIA